MVLGEESRARSVLRPPKYGKMRFGVRGDSINGRVDGKPNECKAMEKIVPVESACMQNAEKIPSDGEDASDARKSPVDILGL